MVDFAVRTKVLKELFADPEWATKMEKAKEMKDVARVIQAFCRARGYEVRRLKK